MFSLHVDTALGWRGGQSQVLQTVLGLRADGHRAAVAANPKGELFQRLRDGLDLLPLAPRSDVDLSAAWALSRLIKVLRPDVIHAHDPRAVATAATARSMVGGTRPALVASRRTPFRIARNSFSRWKYSQVDRFIASCAAVRDRLVDDGIAAARIDVIYGGVDVDLIERVPAVNVHAAFFLPTNAPLVGAVGALVAHNGHEVLVDAASLVVRDVPDARFVIVGDGERRAALERQIREKGLERHVFMAGFRTDVVEMMKGFDVFAASPIHEGLCIALVEAMAAGRAAVATRAGGIPEVLEDGRTGFLVPPRDAGAMARSLRLLLTHDDLRRRMGDAARARARQRFTCGRMARDVAAAYERLAGTRREADTANRAARG